MTDKMEKYMHRNTVYSACTVYMSIEYIYSDEYDYGWLKAKKDGKTEPQ